MPRPKGSKNKKNTAPLPTLEEQRTAILSQKADIEATIATAKETLRSLNKELKKLDAAIAAAVHRLALRHVFRFAAEPFLPFFGLFEPVLAFFKAMPKSFAIVVPPPVLRFICSSPAFSASAFQVHTAPRFPPPPQIPGTTAPRFRQTRRGARLWCTFLPARPFFRCFCGWRRLRRQSPRRGEASGAGISKGDSLSLRPQGARRTF